MTMYAMSDVRVITVHPDNGGCGVPHELGVDTRSIDCPPCEGFLQRTPSLGWANHPGGVKQTCDEIAQTERDEREAKRVGMANLANQLALAVSGGAVPAAPGQPKSLVEQILALSPEEKAAVLVLLGGAQVPAPVISTVDATATEPAPAPKNRGGRPRKQVPAAASAA